MAHVVLAVFAFNKKSKRDWLQNFMFTWEKIIHTINKKTKLEVIVKTLNSFDHHIFFRIKQLDSWLTVRGTMVTGAVILAMGFINFFVKLKC